MVTLILPLRIIDSDKYRAEDAKPTLILKGTLQEFYIKTGYSEDFDHAA